MKTILVVDDSAFIRELLETMLAEQGYNVLVACDGVEAVERFSQSQIDLLITDLMMPKKNGFELMKELLRRMPTLKIVAISSAPENIQEWAQPFGAHAVIEKPIAQTELLAVVRRFLS